MENENGDIIRRKQTGQREGGEEGEGGREGGTETAEDKKKEK